MHFRTIEHFIRNSETSAGQMNVDPISPAGLDGESMVSLDSRYDFPDESPINHRIFTQLGIDFDPDVDTPRKHPMLYVKHGLELVAD